MVHADEHRRVVAKALVVGSFDGETDTPGKAVLEEIHDLLLKNREFEHKGSDDTRLEHPSDRDVNADEENKPLFVIDVNIDRVQPFEFGEPRTVLMILGRLVSINGIWIPIRDSKPFVIAIGLYDVRPSQNEFLDKFFDELEMLKPGSNICRRKGARPRIKLDLRCFICDTIERSYLKGMETYGDAMKKSR